jgi:hypothetical protein
MGQVVKIHYVEINALHNQHLSQGEPFRQSTTGDGTLAVGGVTLALDDGTLTISGGTLTSNDHH